MFLGKDKDISEYIVEALQAGPLRGPAIVERVQKERSSSTTKQAVYTALRNLLHEEVVVKTKEGYALSRFWIKKVNAFAQDQIESSHHNLIRQMQDGDQITYQYKDAFTTDIYWGHVVDILTDLQDPEVPTIFFNPHEWFYDARRESESFYMQRFVDEQKKVFFTIAGNTPLDKAFKKHWQSELFKVNTGMDQFFKPNLYINVFGDYIIEATMSIGFAEELDTWYHRHHTETPEAQQALQELVRKNYRVKFKLSKNKKKAAQLRKKLSKDF